MCLTIQIMSLDVHDERTGVNKRAKTAGYIRRGVAPFSFTPYINSIYALLLSSFSRPIFRLILSNLSDSNSTLYMPSMSLCEQNSTMIIHYLRNQDGMPYKIAKFQFTFIKTFPNDSITTMYSR